MHLERCSSWQPWWILAQREPHRRSKCGPRHSCLGVWSNLSSLYVDKWQMHSRYHQRKVGNVYSQYKYFRLSDLKEARRTSGMLTPADSVKGAHSARQKWLTPAALDAGWTSAIQLSSCFSPLVVHRFRPQLEFYGARK